MPGTQENGPPESLERMTSQAGRGLRVAYLSGPSNAVQIYSETLRNSAPTYFGTNYMQQFLLLVKDVATETWIETWDGSDNYIKTIDDITFCNVPEPVIGGLAYHLSQIKRHFARLRRILEFKPDLVILTGGQDYWWIYSPLKWNGVKFIASFHGAIWTRFHPLRPHERFIRWLNARFALPKLDAVVHTSREIEAQFRELVGTRASETPIFEHLPSYNPAQFDGIKPASELSLAPFRVLFIGRIERSKGVLDIVCIARELERQRAGQFKFEICGDGSALRELRASIDAEGLQDVVTCHGYCRPDAIREQMSRSHAVIVPTRSDLPVGFEMTCAEAVLSGRPLVTSAVCPALHYLREASIEVEPDNVDQYRQAIERLRDDPGLFERKQSACSGLSGQFYDEKRSWRAAMRRALDAVFPMGRRHTGTAP